MNGTSDQLTFFAEEPLANPSQSQDSERDWLTRVVTWPSSSLELLTAFGPAGWFGRTSPACFPVGGGRDFSCFLGGLAQLGYGWAYRVLDAQFFGIPQRRRRPFVVGYLRDWRRAAAVLFERHCLQGHPAPRRQAGQNVAPTISARAKGGGGLRTDFDCDGGLIAFGGNNQAGPISVATAVSVHGGPHGRLDFESETFVAHAFAGEGFDASEDGSGRGTPLVPVGFDCEQGGDTNHGYTENGSPPLRGKSGRTAIAFQTRIGRNGRGQPEEICPALSGADAGETSGMRPVAAIPNAKGWAIRRLTPRECERLMGFSDDYTLISYRGKPAKDGPRYKALGNSWAVPCAAWIGRRIAMVEALPC